MNKSPYLNGRFVLVSLFTAVITAVVTLSVIIITLLRLPRRWCDVFSRIWSRSILRVSGMKVIFEGLEDFSEEPAILIGNHQGFYDVLVLMAYLPRPPVFVGKASIFRIPIFGHAMRAVGHISVDRSHHDKAIASIRQGTINLKKNKQQVVFFPEGTRTRDGKMRDFKKGAFVFAIESGLPLLPFAIEGSHQALPPNKKVVRAGTIYVKALPPINSQAYTMEQRDELLQESYMRINLAVQDLHQKHLKALT